MSQMLAAALALNRFGIGACPGDLERIAADPKAWLRRQVVDPAAFQTKGTGLTDTRSAAVAMQADRERRRDQRQEVPAARDERPPRRAAAPSPNAAPLPPPQPDEIRRLNDIALGEALARLNHGLATEHGFAERLAWFWANHFTVAANKLVTLPFAGAFEREAIRGNLTGTFADLLLASTRHTGMLLYLDQAQSIGPDSLVGRRRDAGLNENLAREILELHTLGVDGGYTQADVTEFARALTGWTTANPRLGRLVGDAEPGSFNFVAAMHEPGTRTVLGKSFRGDEQQARAILADLARHRSTARHIATKLARHFIADDPPGSAIERLERVFLDSGGDLPKLHAALIEQPEAWEPELRKFKTPNEFVISAMRLARIPTVDQRGATVTQELLGQQTFRASSPKGWPDTAPDWAGPDAILKRVEWSQQLAGRIADRQRPADTIEAVLGPLLSERSREAVRRAASPRQGFALALMTPEFQRR
jgi:uncharacterized protein (DUF1800 family)